MLTLIPFEDDRVVGARISGKITRPEFDTVAAALEAALASQSSTPMGSLAKSLYAALGNQGLGGKDFSSIQTFFKHREP